MIKAYELKHFANSGNVKEVVAELHTDVKGDCNHRARSSDTVINVYKGTKSVLHILTERSPSNMDHSTRHSRLTPGLLSSNPYFADPLGIAQRVFTGCNGFQNNNSNYA
jgi:hypothetical protein